MSSHRALHHSLVHLHLPCHTRLRVFPFARESAHARDTHIHTLSHTHTIVFTTADTTQPDNKYKELRPYQTSPNDVFQTMIGLTPKIILAILLLPSFMAPLESG